MRIASFRNRELERLWRHNDARGIARQYERKLRAMPTAIEEAENIAEVDTIPGWRFHPLKGDRKGIWSLTVTRTWRITFRIDPAEGEIFDLDYEDYH